MSRFFRLARAGGALLASLSYCATVAAAPDAEAEQYVTYTGTAVAPTTQKFLYGERHVLKLHAGRLAERVVLYTCSDGAPFARKTVTYVDPLAPNFVLEDESNGMRQGVRSDGHGRDVFYREGRTQAEKTSALPNVPGLVADAGFDEFVRTNWQRLMAGDALTMHFLVPSRLDDMSFRVEHLRSERAAIAGTLSTNVEVFRLKLSNVLGWILPSIDVYYDAKDHMLVRYVGLSDLRNPSHDNFQTEIFFQPGDRKAGSEHEVDDARRARLMPCK